MPWRRCIERGCTNHAQQGPRCLPHRLARLKAKDAKRPSALERGYVSRGWRRQRELVLKRDAFCQFGSVPSERVGMWTPCIYAATVAAHIVPREQGGSDELSNLRGLCKRHHDRETIAHEGGFGRARGGGGL